MVLSSRLEITLEAEMLMMISRLEYRNSRSRRRHISKAELPRTRRRKLYARESPSFKVRLKQRETSSVISRRPIPNRRSRTWLSMLIR